MTDESDARLHAYVAALAAGAVVVLASALVGIARAPIAPTVRVGVAAALFTVGFFALEAASVRFRWRGHLIRTAPAEVAVFLGLIALPGATLPVLAGVARAAHQVANRRPPLKAVANVALGVLFLGAAVAVHALAVDAGVHPVLAAAAGTVAGVVLNEALLALLFSVISRERPLRVLRERFGLPVAFGLLIAIPVGVITVALAALHPLAILGAAPVGVIALRYTALAARADEELELHRRLAGVAQDLVGCAREDEVTERVIRTAADVLDAGAVTLSLADGGEWHHRPDDVRAPTHAGVHAELPGRDRSAIGAISAWPRAGKPAFRAREQELLRVVAAQAATAVEGVRALRENAAQREFIARQETLSTLGTLVAGVAHEISNPLTFMKLRVDVAERETTKAMDAGGEIQRYAEAMRRNLAPLRTGLERLDALAASLKTTARPGTGERAPTDLGEAVQHVVTVVRAGFKHVRYDVRAPPDLPRAHVNAAELHQVLLNLVKNAAEALDGRADPMVEVWAEPADGVVRVHVRDNGPGIPEEARGRLFTPFFTTKGQGTGLGLSISREIAEAHGGTLAVHSTPGEGTCFTLTLPSVE